MQYFLDMKQGKAAAAAVTAAPIASSATTGAAAMKAASTIRSDTAEPLLQWLRETLPHLPSSTLQSYSSVLADAGYDHPSLLPPLQLEDIPSIPNGHGRAITHAAKATSTSDDKR
jgi:hypothetical protein